MHVLLLYFNVFTYRLQDSHIIRYDRFQRPYTDFQSTNVENLNNAVVETSESSVGTMGDYPTGNSVIITDMKSNYVHLLPVLKTQSLHEIGSEIGAVISSQKNDMLEDFQIDSFVKNITDRGIISQPLIFDSLTEDFTFKPKVYLNGNFPVVLEEWIESYPLPGWFSEETDSRPPDISNYTDNIEKIGTKKKEVAQNEENKLLRIPIVINGTFTFGIPIEMINYFRNESCSETRVYTDYLQTNCTETIHVQNNTTKNQSKSEDVASINNSSSTNQTNTSEPTEAEKKQPEEEIIPTYIQDTQYLQRTKPGPNYFKTFNLISRNKIVDQINIYEGVERDLSLNTTQNDTSNPEDTIPNHYYDIYKFFHDAEISNHSSVNSPLYGLVEPEPAPTASTSVKKLSVCDLNLDAGTCVAIIERYYFSALLKQCVKFNYTGCGGNLNNFITEEECESVCVKAIIQRYIYIFEESDTEKEHNHVASLQAYPVNGSETSHIGVQPVFNSTLNFLIALDWTNDMDDLFSPRRIALWNEIEKLLLEAYKNQSDSKPTLIALSKYFDYYNFTNATQVTVRMIYSNPETVIDPLISYIDNPNSPPLYRYVVKESIMINDEEYSPTDNICRRMHIPVVITCREAPWGCCKDGIMSSTGPNNQGCPEANCPCDEIMFSFVLDLTRDEMNRFEDENGVGIAFSVYNKLVDAVNDTYGHKIIDAYIDSRKCDAKLRDTKATRQVYIVDLAIKFMGLVEDAVEPIIKLSKTGRIGGIPVIRNSLIITAAYGIGKRGNLKRNIISHTSKNIFVQDSPIFRLSFNDPDTKKVIKDMSGNRNDFILSDSFSVIKRRTLSNLDLSEECSGTFYPKRNEIATLSMENFEFPVYFKDLTLSVWFLPVKNMNPNKKNGIMYAVSENPNKDNKTAQSIWPALKLNGNSLSASWGNIGCTTESLLQKLDEWTNVVVYYNVVNQSIDMYQNGVQVSSCRGSEQFSSVYDNYKIKKLILGDSSAPFDGPIDELKMYSGKLSEQKILYDYEHCNALMADKMKETCKPECPPPLINKTQNIDKNDKIKPISTCQQYRNRCSRQKSGIYKIVLPSEVFVEQKFYSPYKSIMTYCDMKTFEGGWTLLLTNPSGSVWTPSELFERNVQNPSKNEPFSILRYANSIISSARKNIDYMIKVEMDNYTTGLVISTTNDLNLTSTVPQVNELVLAKKFGTWNFFRSSLSLRVPWIMYKISDDGLRYPILTTSLDSKGNEGVLLDTLNNTFRLFDTFSKERSSIITYWVRENLESEEPTGGYIDISGIEAEISAYYLSVELINLENFPIIVEYYISGSRQYIKIEPKNSTTIFTVIQSVTMPISVSMSASHLITREEMLLNCRKDLNVPIFYLKDDLYIATISKSCETQYPELKEFYYDYMIYNSLDENVILNIKVLNVSSRFLMKPKSFDDWKGGVTYLQDPVFIIYARTAYGNRPLLINNREYWRMYSVPNKNTIVNLVITDAYRAESTDMICYYSMEILNQALTTIDVTWRDDITLAVLDSGERISIIYEMHTSEIEVFQSSVAVQAYPHDLKLIGLLQAFIGERIKENITCSAQKIPKLFIITSNITNLSMLQAELNNRTIVLDQREEQVCPPVIHGGYSAWSSWTLCVGVCPFNGTRSRYRYCDHPRPENGGFTCKEQGLGPSEESEPCQMDKCQANYSLSQDLNFDVQSYEIPEKKINVILELVNTENEPANIHIIIKNFDLIKKTYLNTTIKGLSSKNLIFNNSILPINSMIRMFATDSHNQRVKVSGREDLVLEYKQGFKKLTLYIGKMRNINYYSYFMNVRFINNAGKRIRLVFEKVNTPSFVTQKFVDASSTLVVKTKINSIIPPLPYKIKCDSGENSPFYYLNDESEIFLYPFNSPEDLQIIVIDDIRHNYRTSVKYISLMVANTLEETTWVRLSTIYGTERIKVEPGQVETYKKRIFTPVEIFVHISATSKSNMNNTILIDSLPSVTYVADNAPNAFRYYTLAIKDIMVEFTTYYAKMRIVNLANQPASLSWSLENEYFIEEGREKRFSYQIYSSTPPPAITVKGVLKNGMPSYVNGRPSTYIIPSKNPTEYLTMLLSAGKFLIDVDSDYANNSNSDFIDLNITIINTLYRYIKVRWGWSDDQLINMIIEPRSALSHIIQAPASDPIIFEAKDLINNNTLLVNNTLRFGILPSQFVSSLVIYINNGIVIRRLGLKLLNENSKEDIYVTWTYGEKASSVLIPKNSGIDLKLRLQDIGLPWNFTLSAKTYPNKNPICITPNHDLLIMSSYGIEQLSQLAQNAYDTPWLVFTFSKISPNNIDTCLSAPSDLSKILALKLFSNSSEDMYLNWQDGSIDSPFQNEEFQHSLLIKPLETQIIVFPCADSCAISTIKLSALTKSKQLMLLNNRSTIELPYSSEYSTKISPIFVNMEATNQSNITETVVKYSPVVINTRNEPVILFWKVKQNGTDKIYLPNYGSYPILINISNKDIADILIHAISKESKQQLFVNGVENYSIDSKINCPPYCEFSEQVVIHKEPQVTTSPHDYYRFTLDNKLLRPVIIEIQPGDQVVEIEPLGMTVIQIYVANMSFNDEKSQILINSYDKESGYPLKLNDSTTVQFSRKDDEVSAFYLVIKPPNLSVIPTHSFVFNKETISQFDASDRVDIHGPIEFYTTVIYKPVELQGIVLDGVKRWIGVNLPYSNCLIYPNLCNEGLTYAVRLKIVDYNTDPESLVKLIDTGGDGASSSGVSLHVKGKKILCRVTAVSRTWQIKTAPINNYEMFLMVSWNQEEGLSLYINGSLVSTDSSGEAILYAPNIEMSPNLLVGRGFNRDESKPFRFVIFSFIIFSKNLREKEAKASYLYLSSNKFSKAIITNLRVVNDFGRVIRLIPNKGLVPSSGLIIKPGKKYQVLSLIDLFSKNPSKDSNFIVERSNVDNQKLSLYAEDSEFGTPLYINNRPSPYILKSEQGKEDYVDVVISSKIPDIYPTYHWVMNDVNENLNVVSKTNPEVKYYGQVIVSKTKNGGILLDGFTGNLQIVDVPYKCIFNPGSCDRGVSIMLQVKLEESLGGGDTTLRFILDTGGHHGEGFSIYLLAGRIVAEVSINKQIWKLESGIPYGEWLILVLVWDPKNGGKVELYSNGKLVERATRSADKQGFSNLRNQTIYISKSSVKSGNENFEGARFSIKMLSIFDQILDKTQVLYQFLYYWNHNQPINYPRYINVNFENRAGVDAIVKPDKGEHRDDGYALNTGLMLELRLEEKGPITTYPVIFKAYDTNKHKSLLISGENSLLVMSEEDQNKVSEVIITSKLKCVEPDGLFSDPSDKSSYITCEDSIAIRQRCPSESLWDEEIKSCKITGNVELKNTGAEKVGLKVINITSSPKKIPFILIVRNNESFSVKLDEDSRSIDIVEIPPLKSINHTLVLSPDTSLRLFSHSSRSRDEHLLINGQRYYDLVISEQNNLTFITIHQPDLKPSPTKAPEVKYKGGYQPIKTTPIIPKQKENDVSPSTTPPSHIFYNEAKPAKIVRFAFFASNMVSKSILFLEKYQQINALLLKPNQTARVFLEGEVKEDFVVFVARPNDPRETSQLKINGLDEIKIPTYLLHRKNPPIGAIIIHTADQNYKPRRDMLLGVIAELKRRQPEYNNLYFRIYKTFSSEAIVTDNSMSGLVIRINKSNSLVETTAVDVSLRVQKEAKELRFTGYLPISNESIEINGEKEFKIDLESGLTAPIPMILHLKNQNWTYFYGKIKDSLHDKVTTINSYSGMKTNLSKTQYSRDMVFLVISFINVANKDARIKSISGPLHVDTVFPKGTTSRITMWIPSRSQVELMTMDLEGNILLTNGNATIMVDIDNYSKKPYYITVPISNFDSVGPNENEENDASGAKSSSIYKIRNKLQNDRVKFFVIGRQNIHDLDEKIYSFPSADHLILDQPLHNQKIFAVDTSTGNLLSINGKGYYEEKTKNSFKKDSIVELNIGSSYILNGMTKNIKLEKRSKQVEQNNRHKRWLHLS